VYPAQYCSFLIAILLANLLKRDQARGTRVWAGTGPVDCTTATYRTLRAALDPAERRRMLQSAAHGSTSAHSTPSCASHGLGHVTQTRVRPSLVIDCGPVSTRRSAQP
jgi:hypothetical protein